MKRKTTGRQEFALEDHLLRIVEMNVTACVVPKGSGKVLRFIKLPVGMIVPDLVLVTSSKETTAARCMNRVPSLFECEILALLIRRGPLSRLRLARLLYARDSSLGRALTRLIRDKLLLSNPAGILRVPHNAYPSRISIVSIEAKLTRWKDAIRQAKKYCRFSNKSYVALPETVVAGNDRLRKACIKSGVGLIAVSQKHTDLVLATCNLKPITAERVWLIHKTAFLGKTMRQVTYANGRYVAACSRNRSKA